MDQNQNKQTLTVPLAIVLAGIIVAGAIFFSRAPSVQPTISNDNTDTEVQAAVGAMREVDQNDHILGNPNAKLLIVVYSDTECPFCKRFHFTMKQIMDEYGKNGDVAWVYRHFPLANHTKAATEAAAIECAGKLGGNTAFWKYADRIFEITPSNNGLDLGELPKIASYVGLDTKAFTECLNSGEFNERVKADYDDGLKAGVEGTPHSIIITKDGGKYPIRGAQPYEAVKATIEALLK